MYGEVCGRPCWCQQANTTGLPQSHALQKLVGAFRVLLYGQPYDRADEYVRLSKSTISIAVDKLVNFIADHYASMYLRAPKDNELRDILERTAARGKPGCTGSIDFSHWQWRASPTALQGQYQNRKGTRSVVMEKMCDEDAFVWHLNVGAAGSNNDLNVPPPPPAGPPNRPLARAVPPAAGEHSPRGRATLVTASLGRRRGGGRGGGGAVPLRRGGGALPARGSERRRRGGPPPSHGRGRGWCDHI